LDETKTNFSSQRQMQLQEEEADLQALAERERAIRQLEVKHLASSFKMYAFVFCNFILSFNF
jgi:hypothetical protein